MTKEIVIEKVEVLTEKEAAKYIGMSRTHYRCPGVTTGVKRNPLHYTLHSHYTTGALHYRCQA